MGTTAMADNVISISRYLESRQHHLIDAATKGENLDEGDQDEVEVSLFEIAEVTGESLHNLKQRLGILFLLCMSLINCFDSVDTYRSVRVSARVVRTNKGGKKYARTA